MRLFKYMIIIILVFLLSLSSLGSCFEFTGKSSLLLDTLSGRVFLEYNKEQALPVASVSKLMTLVLALEALDRGEANLGDLVTGSSFAASKRGTRIWLEAGEQFTFEELLYAIAVGSANDGAVAVAEFLAGSEENFVQLMNQRAQELGLSSSTFVNCTGLPEADLHNTMSAEDIAVLALHALEIPTFLDYVSTYEYTMRPQTTKTPVLWNANRLLRRYYGVDGIKTGFTTEAGYCLAATAQRDQLRLLAITLGHKSDEEREKEIRSLLDYGFRKYESILFHTQNTPLGTLTCPLGEPNTVDVVVPKDFYITVERGRELDLTSITTIEQELQPPLLAGSVVGSIKVLYQDEQVGEQVLVIKQDVQKARFLKLMFSFSKALAQAIY